MDGDVNNQPLETLATPTWLSRHRKMIILGGIAVVLAIGAGVTVIVTRGTSGQPSVVKNSNSAKPGNANSSTYDRPTFQRATVVNTSTTLPQPYTTPTKDDLRKAIDKLTTNSNTK